MKIVNSNNPHWIGKNLSIKKPDEISVWEENFVFLSKTLSTYKNLDVQKVNFGDAVITNSSDKSAIGTLIGGAVGGALVGGAGAVVGALATGNNQNEIMYKNIDILFSDGNWLKIEFKISEKTIETRLDKLMYQEFQKRFAHYQANPFDKN